MRIALVLVIALTAGCAKKSKPAAAPANTEMKATESAPGGPNSDSAEEAEGGKGGSPTKGDPCDGGETKGK